MNGVDGNGKRQKINDKKNAAAKIMRNDCGHLKEVVVESFSLFFVFSLAVVS